MSTGLSIAALAIALAGAAGTIYAVIISREALAWKKKQDIARRTPSVRIELEHAADQQQQLMWTAPEDPRPVRLEYRLAVSVVNAGETTEHLKRLRVEDAGRSEGYDLRPVGADEEIRPRARFRSITPLANVPKWESGFVVIASLAGGEEVTSDVEHADAELLTHVEEHNRNARP